MEITERPCPPGPATIQAKAVRLLAEGRIVQAASPVTEFHVEGDTPGSVYRVFVGPRTAVCTCPARAVPCSHLEAVLRRLTAAPDVLGLLDAAIARRRASGPVPR
jgi:hypothetical protein